VADKTVTVRPSGGTYTSLHAAVDGEVVANSDLTAGGMNGILTIQCEGDWSGGADTTAVVMDGFVCDSTHYIVIQTDSANRAKASGWDTSRYRLEVAGATAINVLYWSLTNIDGLQISIDPNANNQRAFNTNHPGTVVKNCRMKNLDTDSTYYEQGVYCSWGPFTIYNCIITGFSPGSDQGHAIFYNSSGNTGYIYNCTLYGNYCGVKAGSGTTLVDSCAVFNNSDDFQGTMTITKCASDDNDAESVAESGGGANWPSDFTDAANGDFTLLSTSNLVGAATVNSGIFTTDIDGTTRGVAWDIGAHEYVAASGTSLAGSITGISVIASFQPYIYRTMINDVVSGQSVVASTQPYIYHTLVNDVVAAQSNLPTVLPYVYHTLINNVVTGLSNIPTLLPYVYHTLVNSIVTGLSNVPTLLPYIYHTLVNSVVSGVSTLFGNLAIIGAQVYQNLMGVVDGVSVVTGNIYEYLFVNAIPSAVSALVGNLSILGSTIGSKLRIYMRIGGGKF
jgi:hypothetical protein